VISYMPSLNLYGYNSNKTNEAYQNVVFFLFNSEQFPRNSKKALGIFRVKDYHKGSLL